MYGILQNYTYAEQSGYNPEIVKGYVVGLQRNNHGVYIFDVAAARAPHHGYVESLTGFVALEVDIGANIDSPYPVTDISFETDPNNPLLIELFTYEADPDDDDSEMVLGVAQALWMALKGKIPKSESMRCKQVFDQNATNKSWLNEIDFLGKIKAEEQF